MLPAISAAPSDPKGMGFVLMVLGGVLFLGGLVGLFALTGPLGFVFMGAGALIALFGWSLAGRPMRA